MGMGNYAAFAEVITEDFVKEISPEKFQELIEVLNEVDDMTLNELASSSQYGNDLVGELNTKCSEEEAQKIVNAYESLCEDFEKKTGLSLYLNYHDAEDRGDEVDGMFWCVDGVYQYSPAGEKYKEKIERKFWTTFG